MPITMLATGSGTGYEAVLDTLQNTFTDTALSGIIVTGVGACAGLVLFWWAIRKCGRMFIKAFSKGKLRI